MAKVVTSQGLTAFVQEGKYSVLDDKGKETPQDVKSEPNPKPVETVSSPPAASSETPPPAEDKTSEEGLEPEDKDFPERVRKRINAKHKAMKEAQEAAAEAERFAETQYNERKLAEGRAQALEDRAKELEAKLAPAKPEEPKEPDKADPKYVKDGVFDWDTYTSDKTTFQVAKALAAERKSQEDARNAAERAANEERMRVRFDKVRQAHPDFDKVLDEVKGTPGDQVPQHVLNYLFESDNGGELHFYLMKHPEETAKISAMKPILGLAELGKLEDRITKPAATNGQAAPVVKVQVGGAPAPITPLSGEGTSGINTDPSKMSYKELRAYERARAREKH